jgi:glycosyltransferase involved in cell wall biosynthesis
MTTRLPISAFIIAQDEADRIGLTINSVKEWVDEIIVIDSGSRDDTVAVSESLGARVVFNAWRGYGPQKVFGEALCRNDWVLNLDADEEITPELGAEIRALFQSGLPGNVAYTLPILPLYPFQESGHRWTAFHHPVRLYRKTFAGFKDSPVHDSVVVHEGRVGHLKGMVNHRSFRSLSHHVDKANFASTARAQDLFQKGRNPSALNLLVIPLLAFFKSYILRREFVNGIDGIVVSHMYAFQRFIRLAKARELHRLTRRGN